VVEIPITVRYDIGGTNIKKIHGGMDSACWESGFKFKFKGEINEHRRTH